MAKGDLHGEFELYILAALCASLIAGLACWRSRRADG